MGRAPRGERAAPRGVNGCIPAANREAQLRGKSCNSMSGMEWRTKFLQRQRLLHCIEHVDCTIFSTMAGKILPFLVDAATFAGRVGSFIFFRPLRSPRATDDVFNRCSRDGCCRFCPNRPPRRRIARARKLGFASSRALLFGYALPYVGCRPRTPLRKAFMRDVLHHYVSFDVFNRPGRCCSTAPAFEFQSMFFKMFCDERGSSRCSPLRGS